LVLVGAGTLVYFSGAWKYVLAATARPEPSPSKEAASRPRGPASRTPWDGLVAIDDRQHDTLGVQDEAVRAHEGPTELVVVGTTDYDLDSLANVRPRFDSQVSKVYVNIGDKVKKGDPLVDLYSSALADAKNDFEKAYSQWQRDKTQLERQEPLFKA